MSIQVHIETLKLEDVEANHSSGTVDVSLGNKRRTVRCFAIKGSGYIKFYGLAVKYRTGQKIWSGSASYKLSDGKVYGLSGGLDHRARFNSVSLIGFYADYSDEIHSKR